MGLGAGRRQVTEKSTVNLVAIMIIEVRVLESVYMELENFKA